MPRVLRGTRHAGARDDELSLPGGHTPPPLRINIPSDEAVQLRDGVAVAALSRGCLRHRPRIHEQKNSKLSNFSADVYGVTESLWATDARRRARGDATTEVVSRYFGIILMSCLNSAGPDIIQIPIGH